MEVWTSVIPQANLEEILYKILIFLRFFRIFHPRTFYSQSLSFILDALRTFTNCPKSQNRTDIEQIL